MYESSDFDESTIVSDPHLSNCYGSTELHLKDGVFYLVLDCEASKGGVREVTHDFAIAFMKQFRVEPNFILNRVLSKVGSREITCPGCHAKIMIDS